jgi:hypothetical protein
MYLSPRHLAVEYGNWHIYLCVILLYLVTGLEHTTAYEQLSGNVYPRQEHLYVCCCFASFARDEIHTQ